MLVLSEQLEYFLAMPFSRRSLGLEARIFGRSLNSALAQKPLLARVSEPSYLTSSWSHTNIATRADLALCAGIATPKTSDTTSSAYRAEFAQTPLSAWPRLTAHFPFAMHEIERSDALIHGALWLVR